MITHAYPLVNPLTITDNIRLASLEDIAAMKLNDVVNDGTRLKDFIDVAYLSCHLSLNQMMAAYEQKYSNINPFIVLKALARTEDADEKEPIDLIKDTYKFKEIRQRLDEMPKNKDKVFELLPCSLTKE